MGPNSIIISSSSVRSNERARSFVRSRRMVGVHRRWTWTGPNAIVAGGESSAHTSRKGTPSAPNSLFSEPRTATPFSSSVQQGAPTGVSPSASWLNPWSWAGAANQRWARRPRRRRLGMQRLRGLIHLFYRHYQLQQILPYYRIAGAEEW